MSFKNRNKELLIQEQIVKYLRLHGYLAFAVPNGSHVPNHATRSLLNRSGLLAGASDLILVDKDCVLFIEVKTPRTYKVSKSTGKEVIDDRGGEQSDAQKDFQKRVEELGYKYVLWTSLDDAIEFCNNK